MYNRPCILSKDIQKIANNILIRFLNLNNLKTILSNEIYFLLKILPLPLYWSLAKITPFVRQLTNS